MTDRELMQQAFDAMSYGNADEREAARIALRSRLAQPEQEPVACQYAKDVAMPEYRCAGKCQYAQPEQEPGTLRIDRLNQWLDASLKDRKPAREQPPQRKPLTDEEKAVLRECREQAMKWTVQGRIPECGAFGEIAQDLDWLCDQLAAHGIKENK